MNKHLDTAQLNEKSTQLRINILKMINKAGSGHPGGSLSAVDIISVLFNRIMNHDPENPEWAGRDRFILSKGHGCPALYAVLADSGYFDVKELDGLRKYGSMLQGHPSKEKIPALEVSSGSLGQGLSIAAGIAFGARLNNERFRVFCLMGDGELQEGQIWEAAMFAANYKLHNLCGIVDCNRLQIDGLVDNVMSVAPFKEKWESFNWNVIEADGHDPNELISVFKQAGNNKNKPTVILANTVKGKGVSFMENKADWHGVAPNDEQLKKALIELRGNACRS